MKLNYKRSGSGPAVVILHGLFGSLDNWQTMANRISEQGYEVYSVDLRNHGKSPHDDEMNHAIMAADVAEFLIDQNITSPTLMGHSMGGKTAMQLALTQPDLIHKLIVVDIAPKPYRPHHNTYFDALLNLDLSDIDNRRAAQDALTQSIKNQSVLQFLLKNLSRKSDGTYSWKFNLDALNDNYLDLISGIENEAVFDKPTLFIAGKFSDYITASDEEAITRLFPKAKIDYIMDAGHWVHAEQPDYFFESVLRFLPS